MIADAESGTEDGRLSVLLRPRAWEKRVNVVGQRSVEEHTVLLRSEVFGNGEVTVEKSLHFLQLFRGRRVGHSVYTGGTHSINLANGSWFGHTLCPKSALHQNTTFYCCATCSSSENTTISVFNLKLFSKHTHMYNCII